MDIPKNWKEMSKSELFQALIDAGYDAHMAEVIVSITKKRR